MSVSKIGFGIRQMEVFTMKRRAIKGEFLFFATVHVGNSSVNYVVININKPPPLILLLGFNSKIFTVENPVNFAINKIQSSQK